MTTERHQIEKNIAKLWNHKLMKNMLLKLLAVVLTKVKLKNAISQGWKNRKFTEVIVKPKKKKKKKDALLQDSNYNLYLNLLQGWTNTTDLNAKRLKIAEKYWETLLQFKIEKAERNRLHEKEMAAMHFQFMTQRTFARNTPAVLGSFLSTKMHYGSYILAASMPLRTQHLKWLPHFQAVRLRHMKLLMGLITFQEFHNKLERRYL